MKRQESEQLEVQALPLRNYLMKYVMPSLTEAMVKCSKIKPEDPVDFLVFKKKPFPTELPLLNISELMRQLNFFYCFFRRNIFYDKKNENCSDEGRAPMLLSSIFMLLHCYNIVIKMKWFENNFVKECVICTLQNELSIQLKNLYKKLITKNKYLALTVKLTFNS